MSGGGERLCGEHGRSEHGSRQNQAAAGEVWIAARGDGGGSRNADAAADRQAEAASRFGMDHRPDEHSDSGIGGAGGVAAVAVGSEESGRDHRAGLSGGAADGVSQPGAGGAAQAKEGGVTASHGEELGEDPQGRGTAEEEA